MAETVTSDKLFEGLLTEEGDELCAMLDGASVPGLLDRIDSEPSLEVECLFRGELEPDMAEVAPYLVKLEPESEFTEWVVGTGWGQHWGSFVTSRQGFRKLRNHLRGLTLIYRRDGTPLYFRYYDPRVLRIFLPTCSPAQLKQMFGPVDAFLAENEAGDALSIYRLNGAELSSVQRRLGGGYSMLLEDEQLAAFAPGLDAQFRARCIEALLSRGQWSEERVARAVDTGLARAVALGLTEERSVLAYLLLATDIALAKPEEAVVRAVEAILAEATLPEWQRVRLAADYWLQMHQPG